jgi:hypothetical protein
VLVLLTIVNAPADEIAGAATNVVLIARAANRLAFLNNMFFSVCLLQISDSVP